MSEKKEHQRPYTDYTHPDWKWAIVKGSLERSFSLYCFCEPKSINGAFHAEDCFPDENGIDSLSQIQNLGGLTIIHYEDGNWIDILNTKNRLYWEIKLEFSGFRVAKPYTKILIGI